MVHGIIKGATAIFLVVPVSVTVLARPLLLQARPESTAAATKAAGQNKRGDRRYLPEAGAVSTSRLALPLKRVWQYLTPGSTSFPPAVDRQRIYVPLTGGRVDCLERETGSLLWSTEPGGVITAPLSVDATAVYVASSKIGADGAEVGASIRAVDCATGLTIWARDYARPFTSPLVVTGNRIYVGSADGALYALACESGDAIWKLQTPDVIHAEALPLNEVIYFGSDDGALRAANLSTGKELWKFQTGGRIIGRPAIEQHAIYIGSADGYVYSIDQALGRPRWRSRLGAAVEASIVLVADRLLVGCLDNFVYVLSRANGDKLWKRRLDSRVTVAPITDGDAMLVAPLRSSRLTVFLTADGRAVNFYELGPDLELVASPTLSRDLLFVPSNSGILALRPSEVSDNTPSAIRK
jgi:eukaryotic-like serine/threonine-protein kinase